MSDILDLSCARARSLLAPYVDGDLVVEEMEWLRGHLAACAPCRAALTAFSQIDSELMGWGRELGSRNPAAPGARERLVARIGAVSAGRRAGMRIPFWVPVAAATIAAGLALIALIPPRTAPVGAREVLAFVEIPYLAPLDPHENATVVRMQIRVATLIAAGYRVAADPEEIVPADVLVGEDGRAHAVRVPADVGLNGIGD
jgi:predicted anti-sigma-YlaC factor YlaD